MSQSYPNPATGPILPKDYYLDEIAADQKADNGVLGVAQLQLNRLSQKNRRTVYAAHGVLPTAAPVNGLPEGRDVLPNATTPAAMIFIDQYQQTDTSTAQARFLGDETLQPAVENTVQQLRGQWAQTPPQPTALPALARLDHRRVQG